MRKNYDFSKAIKNPYAKRLKREPETLARINDNQNKSAGSAVSKKRKAVKSPQRSTRRAGVSGGQELET